MRKSRRVVWAGAFALIAVVNGVALGSLQIASADDRAETTESEIAALEKDVAHKAMTAELVKRAREAIERASRFRAAGDEPHAKISDGLAQAWANAARDLVRAADVEEKAQAARRDATDAGSQAERERALVEEGIAQNGRLRAQLEALGREKKEAPVRTSVQGATIDTAARRSDGGAPKGSSTGAVRGPQAAAVREGGAR